MGREEEIMALKYPEPSVLIKKMCCMDNCKRKIVVTRIDWAKRDDFICQTCRTHRKDEIARKFNTEQTQREEKNS